MKEKYEFLNEDKKISNNKLALLINNIVEEELKKQRLFLGLRDKTLFIVVTIMLILSILFLAIGMEIRIPPKINVETTYITEVSPEDCFLCMENPKYSYFIGQPNIAILNFNTMQYKVIRLNEYDDVGNRLENRGNYVRFENFQGLGSTSSLKSYTERALAQFEVNYNKNSYLDIEKMKEHLCSECCTEIMNQYNYKESHLSVGILYLETREVVPLQESEPFLVKNDYIISTHFDDEFLQSVIVYLPPNSKK